MTHATLTSSSYMKSFYLIPLLVAIGPTLFADSVKSLIPPADSGMNGNGPGELRLFNGIEMIWCPPGTFQMGSAPGEEEFEGESQRAVELTTGFWIARTETTQELWLKMMRENPSKNKGIAEGFKGSDFLSPQYILAIDPQRPVECVSWNDVQNFLKEINNKHPLAPGWKWSLPTSAQWEYACRAGTTTIFSGDLRALAWFDNTSSICETYRVGVRAPNAWNIHDMHGNVMEWCSDWSGGHASVSSINPMGPFNGEFRVVRGGSSQSSSIYCRSAYSTGFTPSSKSVTIGFRLAIVSGNHEHNGLSLKPAGLESQDLVGNSAGESRRVFDFDLIWCPPGEFLMGSAEQSAGSAVSGIKPTVEEEGRQADETAHRVILTKGFWLSKSEVTQKIWLQSAASNPSTFVGENLPVENISWLEVQEWFSVINAKFSLPSGWIFALPTEAQWEYACRAGSNLPFPSTNPEDYCWYKINSNGRTNPVAQKRSNAWGIFDMHGNVSEWCLDYYGEYSSPSVDPSFGVRKNSDLGLKSSFFNDSLNQRVVRGGAWSSTIDRCRSAWRGRASPDVRVNVVGFRLALVQVSP